MEEHIPRKPALPQKSGVAHWACEVLGNTAHCSIQEFLAYNPELLLLQSPTSAEQAASKYTLFHTVQQPQPSLAHCTKLSPRRSQQPWATTFPSALVSAIHTSSPSASLWIIKRQQLTQHPQQWANISFLTKAIKLLHHFIWLKVLNT